jgi:hypothetical protein
VKGLCIEVNPVGVVFSFDGEQPLPGFYYLLEDATGGTGAQNKAFHALLNAFYDWMRKTDQFEFQDGTALYDLRVPSQGDFREFFKYKYGAGASHYQYISDDLQLVKAKKLDEIPEHILSGDIKTGNKLLQLLAECIKSLMAAYPVITRDAAFNTIYKPILDFLSKGVQEGHNPRIKAVLKSWADYTKKQRQRAIDNLFMLVAVSQCDDKRVHEIMDGMKTEE